MDIEQIITIIYDSSIKQRAEIRNQILRGLTASDPEV